MAVRSADFSMLTYKKENQTPELSDEWKCLTHNLAVMMTNFLKMVFELIKKRRTIRKFKQKELKEDSLKKCLEAARLAPSAANLQPLEFVLVRKNLEEVFSCTKWAGYLEDGRPKEGERPVAYIVILSNKEVNEKAEYDVGLAVENMTLVALSEGIGSCILGALKREKLREILEIPEKYKIELVVALGEPSQESIAEEMEKDIKYYLDEEGKVHVPKREFKDIVHEESF